MSTSADRTRTDCDGTSNVDEWVIVYYFVQYQKIVVRVMSYLQYNIHTG